MSWILEALVGVGLTYLFATKFISLIYPNKVEEPFSKESDWGMQ